ncbi:cysteinyl leukotriene receptor 2-like [Saccostrea cucullata]|uniref:cysteinyl leukotriene receptor 2-like n=1 Tax=Saccostrea cuccullata TaxID=36930 RepID=UPI002ED23141
METSEGGKVYYTDMLDILHRLLSNNTIDENDILNYFGKSEFNDITPPRVQRRDQIILIGAPFVFFIGVIGHLMSLLILPYFAKKESTYVYLLSLSIFDLLVLHVGLLVRWLNEILGMNILSHSNFTCKTLTFLSLVFSDTSVWLLVVVTFERFVMLYHPFQATVICKVRRSLIIILLVLGILAMVNSHVFWTLEIVINNVTKQQSCDPAAKSNTMIYQIWPLIDSCIYFILPFLSTCILNGRIIKKIRGIKKRNHLVNARRFLKTTVDQKSPRVERKLTTTMVILSLTFVVSTLPMLVYLCVTAVLNSLHNQPIFSRERYQYFRSFAELMMYCNHAINFYLYIANSKRLRLWFQKRICKQKAEHLVIGNEVFEMQEYSSRYS